MRNVYTMRIAIIEDNENEQIFLKHCLERFSQEQKQDFSITICSSGSLFLQKKEFDFDIIFLDIYMDGLTGMETAQYIRKHNNSVLLIFTTTSAEFAVKSFRVRAFDYLVKPYTYAQFAETMKLCNCALDAQCRFIVVHANRIDQKICCKDILYADYANHYVSIHLEQDLVRTYMPFQDFSDLLQEEKNFILCNRNCLINLDHVVQIGNLGFLLDTKQWVAIKRSTYKEVEQTYANYIFEKMKGTKLL